MTGNGKEDMRRAVAGIQTTAVLIVVAAVLTSGMGASTSGDLLGTLIDADENPDVGVDVEVTNLDNSQSLTATTGSGGVWTADPASISLAAGGAVKFVAAATVLCDPYNPLNVVVSIQQDKWDAGTSLNFQSGHGATPTFPSSTMQFGGIDGTRGAGGDATVTAHMGFQSATAIGGSFTADVDFAFTDNYNSGGAYARTHNFASNLSYIGYIDKNCAWVDTADSILDSDQSHVANVAYGNVNVPETDTDTHTLTGSSAQGQPGDAVAIVVAIKAHLISNDAGVGPNKVDTRAMAIAWVIA